MAEKHMASGQAQSLLVQGNKWEIVQHLEWINGQHSFFMMPGSPIDAFNLHVRWLFRPSTGILIGAIRLLEEGNNTRIVFVTYPSPTDEGPKKFSEFFQRIHDYFKDSIVPESDAWKPTGWGRVDRTVSKIRQALFTAQNEEDFQAIGLLCREAMISLAQAVYAPDLHRSIDDVAPSETDAKRMLESYIAAELPGSSNEELRKYAKDCVQLAASLQHMRNATYREAALCAAALCVTMCETMNIDKLV